MTYNPHFVRIGRHIVNLAAINAMEIGDDGSLALHFNDPKLPVVHVRGDDPAPFLRQLRAMGLLSKLGEEPAAG